MGPLTYTLPTHQTANGERITSTSHTEHPPQKDPISFVASQALLYLQRVEAATQRKSQASQVTPKESTASKEKYIDLLFLLIEHESVKSIPTLITLLEAQAEELMNQKTPELTSEQEKSYLWVQKLLVNDKVSSLASKKLHEFHGIQPSPLASPSLSPKVEIPKQVIEAQKADSPPSSLAQPSPNRNVEFVNNTSRGKIRGEVRFGAAEWKKYFGDVGIEPPLPDNVNEIDNTPCPFSFDPLIKVKDTHMWVLIPAKVNGKPLTLNLLQQLILNPLQGGGCDHYDPDVQEKYGDKAPQMSYWALMTKDVIPGSRFESYADQKALVAGHASYTLPSALAVAVCLSAEYVSSGTRLFPLEPCRTLTRCIETVQERPITVGDFSSTNSFALSKENVTFGGYVKDDQKIGVAAFRKFSTVSVSLSPQSETQKEPLTTLSLPVQVVPNYVAICGATFFGALSWKKYFGVKNVGIEPALPANIVEINNAPCPFSNNPLVKVKDTHMWILIPAIVDGKPFTLDSFSSMFRYPDKSMWRFYDNDHAQYVRPCTEKSNPKTYWALMTRAVIPDSRSRPYKVQKELVERAGYMLPPVLATVVCLSVQYIVSRERLFPNDENSWTYAYCQEQCETKFGTWPIVVGGFNHSFFTIDYNSFDNDNYGAAAFRAFS